MEEMHVPGESAEAADTGSDAILKRRNVGPRKAQCVSDGVDMQVRYLSIKAINSSVAGVFVKALLRPTAGCSNTQARLLPDFVLFFVPRRTSGGKRA